MQPVRSVSPCQAGRQVWRRQTQAELGMPAHLVSHLPGRPPLPGAEAGPQG